MSISTMLAATAIAIAAITLHVPHDPGSGLPGLAGPQDRESIEWVHSYSEALARARRTGKPIFIEFRCRP